MKIKNILDENGQKGRVSGSGFSVRDFRGRDFFMVDNEFLDRKWLRLLKGAPAAVYFSLCRHSNKSQFSFPSLDYVIDETGYGRRQVIRAVKVLEFHRLISVSRKKGEVNVYTLLDRKHWRKSIVVRQYVGRGEASVEEAPVAESM